MPSHGQRLLHEKGLRQSTYFAAKCVDEEKRKLWIESRCDKSRRRWVRNARIDDDDLLVVTSQDCDISCTDDNLDSLLELAVCKPCKKAHPGNTYAHSARTLQFEIDGRWYESKVSNLIYVHKSDLWDCLETTELLSLPEPTSKTFPQWRALRFRRAALPNAFNSVLNPLIHELTEQLDSLGHEYIRAIYIWLDTYDEAPNYKFELLALLREDTPDDVVAQALEHVEQFVDLLDSQETLSANEGDHVYFACRTDQITVSELLRYVRINLDHISLQGGDDQVDIETGS